MTYPTNWFGVFFVFFMAAAAFIGGLHLHILETREPRIRGFGSPRWFWWLTTWPVWVTLKMLHACCVNPRCMGRHTCWVPVSCKCGWRGRLFELVHDYQKEVVTSEDDCADVQPVDQCPGCGSDDLEHYYA